MQTKTVVGQLHLVKHKIDTEDNKPIAQAMYQVPFLQRHTISERIDKMLANNIIRPSNSLWASPFVLVQKRWNFEILC